MKQLPSTKRPLYQMLVVFSLLALIPPAYTQAHSPSLTAEFVGEAVNGEGKWSLVFPSIPGYHYTVEESQDLQNWTPCINGHFYGNGQTLKCHVCDGPLPPTATSSAPIGTPSNLPIWKLRMISFRLEIGNNGQGQYCRLSRAEDQVDGAGPLAAWDTMVWNNFPPRPAGIRIFPLLDAYDFVNHVSYMASVTMVNSVDPVPADTFSETLEESTESALFDELKPQLIGRLLIADQVPQAQVPSPHKYARVRRSVIDTNGNGIPDWYELENFWLASAFATAGSTYYVVPSDDADGDGLTNQAEWEANTNATNADTDGDGSDDFQELKAGKNPKSAASFPPLWRHYKRQLGCSYQGSVTTAKTSEVLISDSWGEVHEEENLPGWLPLNTLSPKLAEDAPFPDSEFEDRILGLRGTSGNGHLLCGFAGLTHVRLFWESDVPATQDINCQVLKVTRRSYGLVEVAATYEALTVTIPVDEVSSTALDINTGFESAGDQDSDHGEYFSVDLYPLDLVLGVPKESLADESPQINILVNAPPPASAADGDLNFLVDNYIVPEEKEDVEGGWAMLNFDDDDNDAGNYSHGQTLLKPDFEDPNGVSHENDLLRLAIMDIPVPGVRFRLKFDNTHIKIWKKATKGTVADELVSMQTDFFVPAGSKQVVVYVEGIKPHDNDHGTIITQQVKIGVNGVWSDGDTVKVRVAHPIMAFFGDGAVSGGDQSLAEWKTDEKKLIKFAKERAGENPSMNRYFFNRLKLPTDPSPNLPYVKDTYLMEGKNQQGDKVCYSCSHLRGTANGAEGAKTNLLEKYLKLAMQVEGTNIILTGHSNYGVGLALGRYFTSFDHFFNMGSGGLPSISSDDFGPNHPAMQLHNVDISWNTVAINDRNNRAAISAPGVTPRVWRSPINRFMAGPGIPANVKRYPLQGLPNPGMGNPFITVNNGGWGGAVWHYYADPALDGNRGDGTANAGPDRHTILLTGAADVPANLRYRSLMLHMCNSFRDFAESFPHGTTIMSWANVGPDYGGSQKFTQGIVDGWSWPKVDTELEKLDIGAHDPSRPNDGLFQITTH